MKMTTGLHAVRCADRNAESTTVIGQLLDNPTARHGRCAMRALRSFTMATLERCNG